MRLSNGSHVEADLVISATGVRPNIGFLENSGVTCLLGVLTDEHMQTNVPGIYAAGDCAEAFDMVSGKTIVSAIQPNAADQAYVAAMNMVGRKAQLKGVTQINVLDTLGLVSTSFGDWQGVPGGQHVELTDRGRRGRHLSLQFDGDVLVGCNSVGWTEHVGVMRGLVEGQVRLGPWKDRLLADPTQLMEAYLARAQAQDAHAHRVTMQITFKLYAGLTQYLPPEARVGNAMPLELPEGTTIVQAIEPFGLPPKLVHWCWSTASTSPPSSAPSTCCVTATCWPSGRPWPEAERGTCSPTIRPASTARWAAPSASGSCGCRARCATRRSRLGDGRGRASTSKAAACD